MYFRQIFDPDLAQYAYLVGCQRTGEALVIDPERDIDRYVAVAAEEGLRIVAAAETHIHADFLSGTRQVAHDLGAVVYLSGEGGEDWTYGWSDADDAEVRLLRDGDIFDIGHIRVRALHTPGHTPEHLSFLVTDIGGGASEPIGIVSGDFVFVGDLGRPDLLESAAGVDGAREPSARRLFASSRRFLELDDHLQVWPGHGAGSACGKALGSVPQSTVGYERRHNAALALPDEGDFVEAILDGQREPPLYFARMKTSNRDGVALLEDLPTPDRMKPEQAVAQGGRDGAVIVDTRGEPATFAEGHLAGSIFAPLGIDFAMIVGSYVEPDQEIILIVDDEEVDRAVRLLARIGYDRVVGHLPPSTLADAVTVSIPRITFDELGSDPGSDGSTVLDVRSGPEFAGGHLPGALHIAHTRLAERLDEVPSDAPIVVHCRSGRRASFAASLLRRTGRAVTWVDGLYSSWPGHSTTEQKPTTV